MVLSCERRTALGVILGGVSFFVSTPCSDAYISPIHDKQLLDDEKLNQYRDPNNPLKISLPPGMFECQGLNLDSGTRLFGAGIGKTILRLSPKSDQAVLQNRDRIEGNNDIQICDLTIDGAAEDQKHSLSGVLMDRVTDSFFDIEVTNCFGSGFLLSGGARNRFGPRTYCHGNGRRSAGYGLYIFGSSDNMVEGGRFDDNCIGIAVEASRPGVRALNNQLIKVRCTANRSDFGQSGAGVHFEQSEGGNCDGGVVVDPVCVESTGVGINNTCCALKITGGYCARNREAAIVTIGAEGFNYKGIVCTDNARGNSTGYKSEMRFDDSGLKPGSKGIVEDCRLTGSAPDGGIRTMSSYSAIRFIGNTVKGYRFPYILSGRADKRT